MMKGSLLFSSLFLLFLGQQVAAQNITAAPTMEFVEEVPEETETDAPTPSPERPESAFPTESPSIRPTQGPTAGPTCDYDPYTYDQIKSNYCASQSSYGNVVPGKCFAEDNSYCITEYDSGCKIVNGYYYYYNQNDDPYRYETYYTVDVTIRDGCQCQSYYYEPDGCSVTIEGFECDKCSFDGQSVTIENCDTLPSWAIEGGLAQLPQTFSFSYGDGGVEFEPSDRMCEHPSVIAATDRNGDLTRTSDLSLPATMTFDFVPGAGEGVDAAIASRLLASGMEFFHQVVGEDSTFQPIVNGISLENADFNFGTDTLGISGDIILALEEKAASKITLRQAAETLAYADWNHYLTKFVSAYAERAPSSSHAKGILESITKVHFRAVGKGRNLAESDTHAF